MRVNLDGNQFFTIPSLCALPTVAEELCFYSAEARRGGKGGNDMRKGFFRFGALALLLLTAAGAWADSLEALRAKAELGSPHEQYDLGMLYQMGKGVPKDNAEAMNWYRKAAERGEALAQLALGQGYEYGQGVPRDFEEAARWYHKAAGQGNAVAQKALGVSCMKGQGVPKSLVQAHAWFSLAAASGDRESLKYLDLVAAKLTPSQIAEAQKLAGERQPGR